MNFALGAIIIFFLLAPGISFRVLYLRSDSLRSNLDSSTVSEMFFIVLISSLVHPLALSLLWKAGFSPEVSQLYLVISGAKASDGLRLDLINGGINYFLSYVFILSALSGVLGYVVQMIVLRFDLDIMYPIMSVSNEWDTLFSGRKLDKALRKKIEFIQVDALVSTSEGDVIYCGVLKQYILNKSGLDKIYLYPTYRRKLSDDKSEVNHTEGDSENITYSTELVTPVSENIGGKADDVRYYNMPGSYFILSYQHIKNINISYIIFSVEEMERKGMDKQTNLST